MHLRGLPLDHVDLPHFSRVSWMAYSDPIRPFLEGMTRFTEIVWCHGRDQRVLRRQDLDLRIGVGVGMFDTSVSECLTPRSAMTRY